VENSGRVCGIAHCLPKDRSPVRISAGHPPPYISAIPVRSLNNVDSGPLSLFMGCGTFLLGTYPGPAPNWNNLAGRYGIILITGFKVGVLISGYKDQMWLLGFGTITTNLNPSPSQNVKFD
jgi:hypothetical protein